MLRRRSGSQGLHILHHPVPAVLLCKKALPLRLLPAFPVAQMVVAHHQKAPLRQKGREGIVAVHIFADAMDQLQNRPGLPFALPGDGVDPGPAIGGKIEVFLFLHHKTAPFPKIHAIMDQTAVFREYPYIITVFSRSVNDWRQKI